MNEFGGAVALVGQCLCVCTWADEKMNGWMDGWMDGWIDGWMDGWMDLWMDGWMD